MRSEEEQFNTYQKGMLEGMKHSNMSIQTKEKLDSIGEELHSVQTNITKQDKDIEFIKQTLSRMDKAFTDLTLSKNIEHEKINERVGKLEIRLAVFTAIGTLVGSFLGPLAQKLFIE